MVSLKDENKAMMQKTSKIKSETKKVREERKPMADELLQKKHERPHWQLTVNESVS